MKGTLNKFQIFNVIAFAVFCIALGQVSSTLLTGVVYSLDPSQILETVRDPATADRNLVILLSSSYTLFSFLIVPFVYLLFIKKSEGIRFLWPKNNMRLISFLWSVVLVFTVIPCTDLLIKFNHQIAFPSELSELEIFFRKSEESARQLIAALLFQNSGDLLVALIVMAIIPGIVEELFFRGIVQTQLQLVFRNVHYAIWLAAFLFSALHFQFYGFIPRMVLGALFGYIFLWTKNIWYACAMHVVNNLASVVGAYYLESHFFTADLGLISWILVIPSILLSGFIVQCIKRSEEQKMFSQ